MTHQTFEALVGGIKELLSYDPETGEFHWLVQRDWKTAPGARAGYLMAHGYRTITIRGARVLEHRLAWAMHHGEDPEGLEIDHINRVRDDNRISNLRLVDRTANQRNRGANKNSKSGLRGVCYHPPTGKWRASLGYGYKSTHLGLYATPEEAHAAFLAAA